VGAPDHLHLTSDRELIRFWHRHVQDAVKLFEMIPSSHRKPAARILDVGSGNGVPGIPIAILEPLWSVELLDSDNKKCGFLDMFCKKYAIKNEHIIVGRAEALGRGAMRESYDIVFSRALGKLPVALELAGSFVKTGGMLIVPHGTSWSTELKDSSLVLETLGLQLIESKEYRLEQTSFLALLFDKVGQTPSTYPRAVGVPEKKPL